jgi:hypothetical protein
LPVTLSDFGDTAKAMRNITQKIILRGNKHWGAKPPSDALGEVLRLINPAVRYAVRMRVEGRSSVRGMRPQWLDAAADVRFVDHDGQDDTTLYFELPEMGVAAPTLYEQQEMWPTRPDPLDTGLDLLGQVISDVAAQNPDSDRFDNPLLRRLGKFSHALNGSFRSLDIVRHNGSADVLASLNDSVVETATRFTSATPSPQQARIYGTLDMIRASTETFGLQLETGEEVRAVADGFAIGELKSLFEQPVLVLGRAIYRPSGRLLRIDATRVIPAGEDQKFFSKIPMPKDRQSTGHTPNRFSQSNGAVSKIFGKWPGDETDEELRAAMEALR